VVRLATHLSDNDNGQAVVRRLMKMRNPVPRVHAMARQWDAPDSDLGFTPPTDKVSAHAYFWGYGVYFPHTWWVQLGQIIASNLTTALKVTAVIKLIGPVCEALEEICVFIAPLAAWLVVNFAVMTEIDAKTHNGAAVHAVWLAPITFIPTKF
jgi:hypothetical protein